MITVWVSVGRGLDRRVAEVRLHNYDELTPKAARAAAQVAFGNTRGPYGVAGAGKAYRISKDGKVRAAKLAE